MEQSVYFRVGAGVIIYNDKNELLMFTRTGKSKDEYALQFPQGGLDSGEEAAEAVWRELFEETTLKRSDFTQIMPYPNWIGYEYDPETKSKLHNHGITNTGQVQRWWFAKAPADLEIDLDRAQDKEFDSYDWIPIDQCVEKVIPFKSEMYQTLIDYLREKII